MEATEATALAVEVWEAMAMEAMEATPTDMDMADLELDMDTLLTASDTAATVAT